MSEIPQIIHFKSPHLQRDEPTGGRVKICMKFIAAFSLLLIHQPLFTFSAADGHFTLLSSHSLTRSLYLFTYRQAQPL